MNRTRLHPRCAWRARAYASSARGIGRVMWQLLVVLMWVVCVVEPAEPRDFSLPATCNATLKKGCSVGGNAYRQLKGADSASCCAACVADTKCAGFVTSNTGSNECLLKADLRDLHIKSSNDCAAVRGSPGPMPPPEPPAPAPPSTPPAGCYTCSYSHEVLTVLFEALHSAARVTRSQTTFAHIPSSFAVK